MLSYLLEVNLCWLFFYLFYAVWLRSETFFHTNRGYLLGTFLLGLVLPLIKLPTPDSEVATVFIAPIGAGIETLELTVISSREAAAAWSIWDVMPLLYWLGVLVMAARVLGGIARIYQLYHNSERQQRVDATLVYSQQDHLPFSFFHMIFLSKKSRFSPADKEKIIRHELAHAQGYHSADVLLLELGSIFFWFSPLAHGYRTSLRVVHEYIADAAVLRNVPRKEYGHLLIKQSQSGVAVAIANSFHSQLKKRINMMFKDKSKNIASWKYLGLLPMVALLLMAFTHQEELPFATEKSGALWPEEVLNDLLIENATVAKEDSVPNNKAGFDEIVVVGYPTADAAKGSADPASVLLSTQTDGATDQPLYVVDGEIIEPDALQDIKPENIAAINVWKGEKALEKYGEKGKDGVIEITLRTAVAEYDTPPFFPGCEDVEDADKKSACAQQKMIEFIYGQLRYPSAAKKAGVEGKVLAKIRFSSTGKVTEVSIMEDLGYGCGEEVKRVLSTMPDWEPATKAGKAVEAEMHLPVVYRLGKEDQAAMDKDPVFKVVEEMPLFPGCENEGLEGAELKQCSDRKMLEFVFREIKYPKAARDANVQGVAVVQFIIDKTGEVRDAKVLRDIGAGCGEEALRVVNLMPRWTPGKQRGKDVAVEFNLPVKFQLEKQEDKPATLKPAEKPAPAQLELQAFSLSPNPSNGMVDLRFQSTAGRIDIQAVDSDGKQVFQQTIPNFDGAFNDRLDLSKAAKGTVFITITQSGKSVSRKVILQ